MTLLQSNECPVTFWRFAGPVIAGNLAAFGAGCLAKRIFANSHESTRKTAQIVATTSIFWLVTGGLWIATTRRPITNGSR